MRVRNYWLYFCLVSLCVSNSAYAVKPYNLGENRVIFNVRKVKGPNKNNDKIIYRYLKNNRINQSYVINKNYRLSTKRNHCLIIYWKNIATKDIGFVIVHRVKPKVWRMRQNGEKGWDNLNESDAKFRWSNRGRSLGITLFNEDPKSVYCQFSGDIDY